MEKHDLKIILCLLSLALPLCAAVPDGYVVKVDSASVYLDWGKASGAAAGDQFKIYRAGEPLKHPVTGEVVGQTQVDLGQGVVDTIEEKFAIGRIVESKGDIKAGDRTHHLDAAPAAAESAVPVTVPKELWHSEKIAHEATGLAVGNVGGQRQTQRHRRLSRSNRSVPAGMARLWNQRLSIIPVTSLIF